MGPDRGIDVEQARLPFLLHAIPRLHPGAWAVPSVTLSIASLLVFFGVFAYLNRSEIVRSLFRLPVDPVVAALPSLILAAGIATVARSRPGPLLPRLWTIALASIAGATTGWAVAERFFVPRGRPIVHALAVATLLATAILTLRLVRVYPHHWLVHHVSLLGLGVVLAVGLPLVLMIETHAVKGEQDRLAQTVAQLETAAESLHAAAAEDWPKLSRNPELVAVTLDRFRRLSVETWAPDRYVWEGARLLGVESRLADASARLLARSLAAATSPRAPVLRIPQMAYNRAARVWEPHPQFAATAKIVAEYHREAGRLFRETVALTRDAPPGLRTDAIEATRRFDAHIALLAGAWGRQWLAPVLDPRQPRASLATLFDLPLAPTAPPASALDALMRLPPSGAAAFERTDSTCQGSRYTELPYDYHRVDCYAYEAISDGGSARMFAEYRIVYRTRSASGHASPAPPTPDELFLFLPFAEGKTLGDYTPEVMQGLYSAVERRYSVRPTTARGGPPTDGFFFFGASGRLHVSRASTVPGLRAVQVRVCSPVCK